MKVRVHPSICELYLTKKALRPFSWLGLVSLIFLGFSGSSYGIEAGFSKKTITPKTFDSWEDLNNNAKKDADEPYIDRNKNGKFDPLYLAGFHQNRPVAGVHDDIYAVASVFRSKNGQTLGIVTLDVIGFMIDDVKKIRKKVQASIPNMHVVVHSLHNHETPDTQGLWGPNLFTTGVNKDYLEFVVSRASEAIVEAHSKLASVEIHHAEIHGYDKEFGVIDTRVPKVLERGIRSIIFTNKISGKVEGSWIHFSNHVETIWSDNLLITADWPGALRNAAENGASILEAKSFSRKRLVRYELGGVSSVFIGNIGGLATTLPDTPVKNPQTGSYMTGATFDKVKAQGEAIALKVMQYWHANKFKKSSNHNLFIKKNTFRLRVKNMVFIAAAMSGLIDRKMRRLPFVTIESEVNHIGIGPLEILTIPGELYPEIAHGGIENLPGSDHDTEPEEIPPLYSLMEGEINMIWNLANDSVGYIIPHTEWDEKAPYLNLAEKATYGETNSVGDTSGRQIHEEASKILAE